MSPAGRDTRPALRRRGHPVERLDPHTPIGLNPNGAYKPHNWYVYGQHPDIVMLDDYPLMYAGPIENVSGSRRDATSAAAPNPVIHIYQNCRWPREGLKRPMTAGELRRLMTYPIGEGARGLIGWWWNVTFKEMGKQSFATREYPDLWAAQSQVFRQLHLVAPLM